MEVISLILARKYNPDETLGTYIVMDDNREVFRCCCIELPWLNNLHNKSCIQGCAIYDIEKISTPKHPNSFLITDVPGREGIMIHIGNYATGLKIDTDGCQLPGMNFVDLDGNGTMDVAQSTIAMNALNHFLPDKCKLCIIN
jgi:hypothetical protein